MAATLVSAPIGIGVDVVDIADFEQIPFESNQLFYQRCFSSTEIEYCRGRARPAQHFAARFAAKEAAVKALSGRMQLAYWQAEVERGFDGKPNLRLWNHDRSAALEDLTDVELRLSLTHSDAIAAAVVIAYSKDHDGD